MTDLVNNPNIKVHGLKRAKLRDSIYFCVSDFEESVSREVMLSTRKPGALYGRGRTSHSLTGLDLKLASYANSLGYLAVSLLHTTNCSILYNSSRTIAVDDLTVRTQPVDDENIKIDISFSGNLHATLQYKIV